MDFIEDLDEYNKAMANAFDFITGKTTLDDLLEDMEGGLIATYNLPFNPEVSDGRDPSTIDMVIEHFSELEEYEKCEELMKWKWGVEDL
jgi:hypothetical protein|tara:strand:- start:1402 stop:1668 length:267 start_codon:yes stop_codon:yes gene_type:complete